MGEITPQEFVAKWSRSDLKESASSQEHFIDLCRLLGHGSPAELDPDGNWFTFEYGATKLSGEDGWADVWKKGCFGWEYKGKNRSLQKAFDQLLQYRQSLENPPLLIVSDINRIVIHTNFTNSVKREYEIELGDLLDPESRNLIWQAFNDPDKLRDPKSPEYVTEEAAERFGKLAEIMAKWGEDPQKVAHFLIQILFCLFSEDIGILPRDLFTRLLHREIRITTDLTEPLSKLFKAMSEGTWFGEHKLPLIDGGLFQSGKVLEVPGDALEILRAVSDLDWSSIEPAVFGTLFERSLDPSKRSQLGAHYTSREDINLVVEPVLMKPLRERWTSYRDEFRAIREEAESTTDDAKRRELVDEAKSRLLGFMDELRLVVVFDPACGSGNFLYVSLTKLLDLQKEVIGELKTLGITDVKPTVDPVQLHGVEINTYARELAEATIWIGYIQWMYQNGYGFPDEPILKPIDSISNSDAVIDRSRDDYSEPDWPESFVIIGNPPYLGDKKMISELGENYVADLRSLYEGRLPGQSDLVCYWFEKARAQIESGMAKRAGLLATQAIRGGANRVVLERILKSGGIFWAESDRDWVLDGANVNVSMVGFDNGSQQEKCLDGNKVKAIYPDLTSHVDLTVAKPLDENKDLSFIGTQKSGPFDISEKQARTLLSKGGNPHNRPNSDVIKPWVNGWDITRRPRGKWVIDFGAHMTVKEAAKYEAPFEYVKEHVKPKRDKVRRKNHRVYWWIHGEARPGMRKALKQVSRYLITPRVAKYRVWAWMDASVIPDSATVVVAREDDYMMGVLHSRVHEAWSLSKGTHLEERPRYTPTTTFQTFPLPWPAGMEDQASPSYKAIAIAAKKLIEKRDNWLHPDDVPDSELKRRTLTNLYNSMPEWLIIAHRELDNAVLSAYGWAKDFSGKKILRKLLALNLERKGS